MSRFELIATATFGLEALVADELRKLGYSHTQVENGKVTFSGDELAICRSNLWLRTAARVRVKVGEFRATTFEELFEETKALPWAEFIPANAQFPVEDVLCSPPSIVSPIANPSSKSRCGKPQAASTGVVSRRRSLMKIEIAL